MAMHAPAVRWVAVAFLHPAAGCAFDVSHVRREPIAYAADPACTALFTLTAPESVSVESGFATALRAPTRWRCIGRTDAGQVFATANQIVTVEASNIYEATLVVHDGVLAGSYLPEDRMWVPLASPVLLKRTETVP